MFYETYKQMEQDFGHDREMVSKVYQIDFDDVVQCADDGTTTFGLLATKELVKRKCKEKNFYSSLGHTLLNRIQEMKGYSEVNVKNSRRLITTSNDCISSIHLLIREKMHLNVYFRSSDYDGALPADLEFISRIPSEVIHHLILFSKEPGYEEVTDEFLKSISEMKVQVTLFFGSLHRTNKIG